MQIRKAIMNDTEYIYELIKMYSSQGTLLPRTRLSIYEKLQCFHVAVEGNDIVGVVSLHILDYDLAEVRSLVVHPKHTSKGIGYKLVHSVIEETRKLGVNRLISLTYEIDFFHKCGFEIVRMATLPQKMWKDCINCPKLNSCDETAMLINASYV